MPKPICFMVMPFRTKPTGAVAPAPAPASVDFDALWNKAFLPVIEGLGYQPVRADQDLGALIIKDMLERLFFSDLMLADLTIPNGNVYYEIGVRHAVKQDNCVLLSADWSSQLFDLEQIRQARYPLPDGAVSDAAAAAVRAAIAPAIEKMAAGTSPVFETLPGYPTNVQPERASVIRGFLDEISAFQAMVRAVRAAPQADQAARTRELRDRFPAADMKLPSVALDLVYLLRDHVGWPETMAYIDALPAAIKNLPILREQRCLAQSKFGDHVAAIGALEELVAVSGDSSERQGLLGGSYKRLYRTAAAPADKLRYLGKAIEHYERGMWLDLNDYYPSCNLPQLYRERGHRGDDERARAAATVAKLACERAIARGADDTWTRPTLVGLQFHAGAVDAIDELCDRIATDGPAAWMLESTLADLTEIVRTTPDPTTRAGLDQALTRLRALLPAAPA